MQYQFKDTMRLNTKSLLSTLVNLYLRNGRDLLAMSQLSRDKIMAIELEIIRRCKGWKDRNQRNQGNEV